MFLVAHVPRPNLEPLCFSLVPQRTASHQVHGRLCARSCPRALALSPALNCFSRCTVCTYIISDLHLPPCAHSLHQSPPLHPNKKATSTTLRRYLPWVLTKAKPSRALSLPSYLLCSLGSIMWTLAAEPILPHLPYIHTTNTIQSALQRNPHTKLFSHPIPIPLTKSNPILLQAP